jgi:hypothetical protein
MNSLTFTKISVRSLLTLALITGVLMLTLFAGVGRASADNSISTTNASSSSLMLSGSGFVPQEKINLWTTSPSGQALDAGYIFADSNGSFSLKIDASDPNAVASSGNYTTLTDNYDADGNFISEYWETTLKDNPATGSWSITADSTTTSTVKVYSFTVAS